MQTHELSTQVEQIGDLSRKLDLRLNKSSVTLCATLASLMTWHLKTPLNAFSENR